MEYYTEPASKILTAETITDLLASKSIREKEIINENVVGCQSCYFNAVCKTRKVLPCMGHNRPDRKSVYYQGVK